MRRPPRALTGTTLAALLLASPAGAQGPGVTVDPGSPTGKEYAIPLDSERRQADPTGSQRVDRSGSVSPRPVAADPPLFGVGIKPARRTATAARSGGDPKSRRSTAGRGDARSSSVAAPPGDARATLAVATQHPGAPQGGLGTPLVITLAASGILLIGGLIGLALRRRRGVG